MNANDVEELKSNVEINFKLWLKQQLITMLICLLATVLIICGIYSAYYLYGIAFINHWFMVWKTR